MSAPDGPGLPSAVDGQARAKGELIVTGAAADAGSLQDRFLQFKKERKRERALAKRCAEQCVAPGGERNVERLRQRFVDTCMGYIGLPYSRKKHAPDDPDYHAPLFLDCCGLVRRAVQDLQEDFGFGIGRWNQAYQFETLPQELTFEELRPGDLIFVEGTYFEKERKPQRHDIVHVEVFIGGETGEATVGSRWGKSDPSEGKVRGVQVHPCYRYVSKLYEIHKYHFRSLDTWLQGSCRSHSYADASAAPAGLQCGGRSIFEGGEQADSDAEVLEVFVPDPYRADPAFYVGDGNNWRVIADALERLGWRRLPFEAGFSNRFDLKWVEQRARIDYRRHVEGQLVNHIPNNDVITSKARFLDTARAHEAAGNPAPTGWSHPASYSSERAGERLAALADAEAADAAGAEAVWLLKPSRGNGGKGIEIVRGAATLRERLFPPAADVAGTSRGSRPVEGWVVQRYVDRPLLLAGRKFDVRVYCLVARTEPALWLFHPGYCKVALEEYSEDFENRFAHLTNACVQRAHPSYKLQRGRHIWSDAEAEAELIASGRWSADRGPFWPAIHERMRRAMGWIFEASRGLLERRRGFFDLLGADFLLDDDLGLHLLEVNSNPALFFDSSPTLEELVPSLIGASLELVLESQRPGKEHVVPPVPAPFLIVADESSGFVYGKS